MGRSGLERTGENGRGGKGKEERENEQGNIPLGVLICLPDLGLGVGGEYWAVAVPGHCGTLRSPQYLLHEYTACKFVVAWIQSNLGM